MTTGLRPNPEIPKAGRTSWYNAFVMFFRAVVHNAEEGGYWAEVPALPGCFTEAETREELLANIKEAIQGCLAVLNNREGSPDKVREIVDVTV